MSRPRNNAGLFLCSDPSGTINVMKTDDKHRGKPTGYDAKSHVLWGASLARRGCTAAEIAEAFGITDRTLYRWQKAHPELCQALKASRSQADEAIVDSLYARAIGKAKRTTKKKRDVLDSDGRKVTLTEVIEETLPPDTTAMIYWLKNRQPELWRDRPRQDDTDTAVLKAAKELVSSVQSAIE